MEIDNIPLFNKPQKMKSSRLTSELAKKIEAADGVIATQSTTTPFQRPKNALACCPRHLPMVNSCVMIVGIPAHRIFSHASAPSNSGKAAIMRQVPSSSAAPQAFDEKGSLKDKATVKKLDLP